MLQNIKDEHKEKIEELLQEIIEVYEGDNWLTVKKYVLRYSHPDIRKYFSTRHHYTKKHTLNDFEISLISFCKEKYDIDLELKIEDKHNENT